MAKTLDSYEHEERERERIAGLEAEVESLQAQLTEVTRERDEALRPRIYVNGIEVKPTDIIERTPTTLRIVRKPDATR